MPMQAVLIESDGVHFEWRQDMTMPTQKLAGIRCDRGEGEDAVRKHVVELGARSLLGAQKNRFGRFGV